MHVLNAWYAAAWSGELGHNPLGRSLLGKRVVLFRDDEGQPHILNARCPHRGADLSSGRLVDGCLECPFHGWRFDLDGHCVQIPSQPDSAKIPPTANVQCIQVEEQEGIIWICDGRTSDKPPSRQLTGDGRRVTLPGRLLNGGVTRVLENALDTAHNAFIHKRAFGSALDPIIQRQLVVVDEVQHTVTATPDPHSPWVPVGPLITGPMGLIAGLLGQSSPRFRFAEFKLGGRIKIYIEYSSGTWDAFFFYLSPSDTAHTWVFYETLRTRAPLRLFDVIQRNFMKKIMDDGENELSLIVREEFQPRRPVSVESDRFGIAAQKYFLKNLSGNGSSTAQTPSGVVADEIGVQCR